jgi:plasmid stability protein
VSYGFAAAGRVLDHHGGAAARKSRYDGQRKSVTAGAVHGKMGILTTVLHPAMSELRIRKVEERIAAALRARARRHDRSLEEELRVLLRDEALREKLAVAERAAGQLERLRQKRGTLRDSAVFIREDRNARG